MPGIALAIVFGSILSFSAYPQVRLQFDPPSLSLARDESALVRLNVVGIPDDGRGLVAFQFSTAYEASLLEIVDPNEGLGVPAFIPLGGFSGCAEMTGEPNCLEPEWFLTMARANAVGSTARRNGRLQVAYGTRGGDLPVTGSGTIALLLITAKQVEGAGEIALQDVTLVQDGLVPTPYPTAYPVLSVQIGHRAASEPQGETSLPVVDGSSSPDMVVAAVPPALSATDSPDSMAEPSAGVAFALRRSLHAEADAFGAALVTHTP